MLHLPLNNQISEVNEITIKILTDEIEKSFQKNWSIVIVRVNRRLGPSYTIIKESIITVILTNGEKCLMELDNLNLRRCLIRIGKRSKSENIEIVFSKPAFVDLKELSPPIN